MRAAMLGAYAFIASCAFNEIAIPRTTATVVVHGVLNPSASTQVILLERTLSGAANTKDSLFDPSDPIATGGGIPINGATVEIIDSTGRIFRGIEDKITATGKGTGVYRVTLGPPTLRNGARYQLHVRTVEGEEVTAATRLPRPTVTSAGALNRTFNRDHDSLLVAWPRTPGARAYAVRVESPFGPFFLFTDSTVFGLPGDARNLFADQFQRLFIPGFRQDVFVGAVDSNFYDYYRTTNDPFTGTGVISRINGGLGMFGSVVTLSSGTLTVIADQTEPIEGRFRLTPPSTDLTVLASTITLYIESKSTRPDVGDAISGRFTSSSPLGGSGALLGLQNGDRISFALLSNQLAGDTIDVFEGALQGGTITGSYRKRGGVWAFVKQ